MKRMVMITLDEEVHRKHKLARHNISKLCNDFLANYDIDLKALEKEKKQVVAKEVNAVKDYREKEQEDEETNKRLAEAAAARATNMEKCNRIITEVCKNHDMERAEAVRRMEKT